MKINNLLEHASPRSFICYLPEFPSKLRSLIIHENDATMNEKLTQRIEAMKRRKPVDCNNVNTNYSENIMTDLYEKWNMVDEEIKNTIKKHSIIPLCKKGCNECCKEYFYFSIVEYFAIRHELLKQNLFEDILEKAKVQEKQMAEYSIDEYNKLNDKTLCDVNHTFNDKEFVNKFEMCLCNINGTCAVYNVRPFICRAFGVTIQHDLCSVIYKKTKHIFSKKINQSKAKKYVAMLKFDLNFIANNTEMFSCNGNLIIPRPYPLFFWFCHDKEYVHLYDVAFNGSKENFSALLSRVRNTQMPISSENKKRKQMY